MALRREFLHQLDDDKLSLIQLPADGNCWYEVVFVISSGGCYGK